MRNPNYALQACQITNLIERFYFGTRVFDPIEEVHVDLDPIPWFVREREAAPIHPVIDAALRLASPNSIYLLVREYPHVADSDSSKIAYTRNDADGERDRQVTTSASKYLTRHFPALPSHTIRDLTAHLGKQTFALWDAKDLIVKAVQEGPRSCMQWDDDEIRRRGGHPYEVYDPALGWRMAVRLEGTQIMGRCLVNTSTNGQYFVRSYKRDAEGGYSYSDEALQSWLCSQGFERSSDWLGCDIREIEGSDGAPILPYLDGDEKHVARHLGVFRIVAEDDDPAYKCDNTDGRGDSIEDRPTCEDCGDSYDEDDGTYVGYHSDRCVCSGCIDSYRYVTGRRGHDYYVPEDEAIETVNGDWYDSNCLGDNNIVELRNGDYDHLDNCVCIDDEWYSADDDDVVWLEDTGEHAIRDEGCWQCEESDKWYSDNIDSVEIDGKTYHPDSDAAERYELEQQGQQTFDI